MAIFSENELIKYNRNGRLIELCVHVDMNYDSLETILNVVEYPARESSMGFCHCLHDAHNTTMPSFFFFYFFFHCMNANAIWNRIGCCTTEKMIKKN